MSMSAPSTADYLVDRRRLRRRLFFWRFATILVLALALAGLAFLIAKPERTGGFFGPHIARLSINGLITGDDATLKLLRDVGRSEASAVILDIESPGGTTTGAERLYEEIRKLAVKKPVVAVVGTMAASGAYIAAIGADQIFARQNSLVGSIGVLFEFPNVSKLLDNVGVSVETIKSTPLKAAPNGFEPTSPAAHDAIAALVADSYAWFKDLVKDRRKMSDAELAKIDDGRVFTGRQSVPLKLIDRLGGQDEAVAWLEHDRGIAKDLPIRDWRVDNPLGRFGFFSSATAKAAAVATLLGFEDMAHAIQRAGGEVDRPPLDGLMSVWHVGLHF